MAKGRGVLERAAARAKSSSSVSLIVMLATAGLLVFQVGMAGQWGAHDPGVRPGASAGAPLAGLNADELEYFNASKVEFAEAEEVDEGLGPRMNLDSCGGCHMQPALGGTSPAVNPQVAFAHLNGGTDFVPSILRADRFARRGLSATLTERPTAVSTPCSPSLDGWARMAARSGSRTLRINSRTTT